MSDVYNALTRQLGAVEILGGMLGDPALKVDTATKGIQYKDKSYSVAEEINVGIGGRFVVLAGATSPIPSPSLDQPFLATRATIPSSVALYFMLQFAQVSSVVLLDGDAICGDIFSEVSLNNGVRWPTAQTGQSFKFSFQNTDVADHEPRFSLTGVRLR